MHQPVLVREVIAGLEPTRGDVVVDGTVGAGGHAEAILPRILPGGRLIGIDQDAEAIARARARLAPFAEAVTLVQANARELQTTLDQLGVAQADRLLFDLGLSSDQLDEAGRGFSFLQEGPLDMRMDRRQPATAGQLVNRLPERELAMIIQRFGEERHARRIARSIVRARQRRPIRTTIELSRVVAEASPWPRARLHPATRTFQALRIAVNHELESLEAALPQAVERLRPGGRIAVISFHSLEDRVVKRTFRVYAKEHRLKLVTKRPLGPSAEEVAANPRARSARLRIAEKLA